MERVNFIVQQDNFCVMIAYYEEGQGKFGLIYNVMADQLFYVVASLMCIAMTNCFLPIKIDLRPVPSR